MNQPFTAHTALVADLRELEWLMRRMLWVMANYPPESRECEDAKAGMEGSVMFPRRYDRGGYPFDAAQESMLFPPDREFCDPASMIHQNIAGVRMNNGAPVREIVATPGRTDGYESDADRAFWTCAQCGQTAQAMISNGPGGDICKYCHHENETGTKLGRITVREA